MSTPWSRSGSLVSDRIRPRPPQQQHQQHQHQIKGKGKAGTPEPPKSNAVRALEAQRDAARASDARTKDPKGGCFCQARKHALSSYVPMCRQCGLILCTLNPPYCACPHCTSPLLSDQDRASLLRRLEDELDTQLAREEAERQKAIDDARAAEGAFPMLPGSQTAVKTSRGPGPGPVPPSTTRTVLSLNSETKRVTVSSYNTSSTVTQSRPASRAEDKEEGRVPRPLGEVSYVTEKPDPERPWRNVRAGDIRYIQPPGGASGDAGNPSRRRRKKGGERSAANTELNG